jgi:hypothetical protein
MLLSTSSTARALRRAAAVAALGVANAWIVPAMAAPPPMTPADKLTFAEVSRDTLDWFGAHRGVSVALVIGLTALVTGIVINREPG